MWIKHKDQIINLDNVCRIEKSPEQISFLHHYATEYKDVTSRINFESEEKCEEAYKDIMAALVRGEKIICL